MSNYLVTGAAGFIASRVAEMLLDAGHTVDLVTYPFGDDIELEGLRTFRAGRPPFIRDVKIGPSVAKIFLDVFLYFQVRSLLREHRYDVVHSHEEAAFFVMGFARRYGMKHVYDMHSYLPQQLQSHALLLQLPVNLFPIRLGAYSLPLLFPLKNLP